MVVVLGGKISLTCNLTSMWVSINMIRNMVTASSPGNLVQFTKVITFKMRGMATARCTSLTLPFIKVTGRGASRQAQLS
jgi:hypothetical protein